MQRALWLKALILLAIAIGLLLPLALIERTVAERAGRRAEAVASVQQSLAGAQTVVVPYVVWPYREVWDEWEPGFDRSSAVQRTRVRKHSEHRLYLFAERADLTAAVDVREDHYRGLHRVRTFEAGLQLRAALSLAPARAIKPQRDAGRIEPGQAVLVLGLADVRGLRGAPALRINGAPLAFQQGTGGLATGGGVHANLPATATDLPLVIEIDFALAGAEQLAVVPTAGTTTTAVRSAWPHPSFSGAFLPSQRAVDAEGFSATWSVAALASGVQGQLDGSAPRSATNQPLQAFSVAFIEPVNVYLLAERATKYGALFMALVLAVVFLVDTLLRRPVHPVQYALVGLALAIFFLLLLSLAEHLPFALAYALAAGSCVALIGFYLRHALQGARAALALGAGLAALYSAIYVILVAEQTALLMGAALLFAALATVMIATRKVDWYRLPAPT